MEMINKGSGSTSAEGKLEWRINVPNGTTQKLMSQSTSTSTCSSTIRSAFIHSVWLMKIWKFLGKAWSIGVDDPKKFIHCLKVGLALTAVSFFYYVRALYDSVGGTAMWAVMTVVVVFEFTVGGTLYKSINRATATFLAASLGVGIQWVAAQSGETFEPIVIGVAVFLLASATTFSRFLPIVKERFDYGCTIFILTFSLVSISGYRVDELVEMAHERLSTIAIGTAMCILISMFFCPNWAGSQLRHLIIRNLDKLAHSLDGCVAEYFEEDDHKESKDEVDDTTTKVQGYKCVLNSKATEDSMANFARWEPAHGRFGFRHPWKMYLKIGAAMRRCAYCIEALNASLDSDFQAPKYLKKLLKEPCMSLSSNSSKVLKELATIMKTMTKSTKIDFAIVEMNFAVQQVQSAIKSLPSDLLVAQSSSSSSSSMSSFESVGNGVEADQANDDPVGDVRVKLKGMPAPRPMLLMEVLQLATLSSLMIEISSRIEDVVSEVEELANLADFMPATVQKPKQNQSSNNNKKSQNLVKQIHA